MGTDYVLIVEKGMFKLREVSKVKDPFEVPVTPYTNPCTPECTMRTRGHNHVVRRRKKR